MEIKLDTAVSSASSFVTTDGFAVCLHCVSQLSLARSPEILLPNALPTLRGCVHFYRYKETSVVGNLQVETLAENVPN